MFVLWIKLKLWIKLSSVEEALFENKVCASCVLNDIAKKKEKIRLVSRDCKKTVQLTARPAILQCYT